jgi:hypothetical protein
MGVHLLQAASLLFHALETSNVRHLHGAVFGFPVIIGDVLHAALPANLFDLAAGLELFQHLHELRFDEMTFTHGGSPLHCKHAGELQLPRGLNQGVVIIRSSLQPLGDTCEALRVLHQRYW